MRFNLFVTLFILLPALCFSGTLRGRLTDENGQGLPFASIYIKETTSGTATNENGYYSLQLDSGIYTLEFKYVGYKAKTEIVKINGHPVELNVQLLPEVLNLKEVVVRAADEDPAYPIMRNAIRLRKYHQNEALAWSARVYMKSVARMDKVPSKVLGIRVVDVDTGIVYLSESVSQLHVKRPNKINERVISSRVSGQKKGFSFNQASEMNVSFYDNLLKIQGLSERGFVSPLANNALFFYKYQYLGAFEENGRTINKIKVIPRRRNDPVFEGIIYICDGAWRIHSTDLKLTKRAGIEFVDFIRVRQVYAPVLEHVWMPVSQKFTFEAAGLGFKGRGYVTGVYSNYKVQAAYKKPPVLEEIEPEPEVIAAATQAAKPTPKPKFKIIEPEKADPAEKPLHPDKLFSKEILVIEEKSNKRDSLYWDKIRPVPLTKEESKDYVKKDKLEAVKESKVYQDSLDRIRNKPTFGNLFLSGYTYRNSYEDNYLRFDPLISPTSNSILQYNTVEGVVTDVKVTYGRRFDDRRRYVIEPAVRYGFSNQKLNGKLRAAYVYNTTTNSIVQVEGGRYVQQINNTDPISPFVNAAYTLVAEKNYMKLYQRDFIRLSHRGELANGLQLTANLEYAHRMPMQNTAFYSFKKNNPEGGTNFTPNVPENAELVDATFMPHEVLMASFYVSIKPGQRYITRPDQKINLDSKYPTFSLAYRTGIKAFGGDIKYSTAAIGINDEVGFGLFGTSTYNASAGVFWNKDEMTLLDYRHFTGNRTFFAGNYNGFQLLDYYKYSTNNNYLVANYEHHFNGFLFNKVPLLRKLKMQEVFSLNYLNTQQSRNYVELGVGVEHILKVLRVDFVTSFQEGQKARSGIVIGLGF
ncbi:DUF5686 and carboxypeptidase regulatory-like domain-containing protein [Pontibacter fetidus]|uniref:Carboxypeptidase-like regulatory domain-containing protein n=1 Tax=Pontibacter fetidus TaxID=2700082 RepID=A0A6B2H8F1_9BACT|nr:DUF5686 and carboxypeptidase regulatory-like domain-containing protein [Pontibacter fetidus]NDK56857.1 carboxypeptidase-like regulatory domain-containing protein [Pontibacter fetidus]